MIQQDDMELSAYIRNEWNNDRSWLSSSSRTRKRRTRVEYGMVVKYKLDNVVRGLFGTFLPEPCC
jgi:hypothetical protein